MSNISRRRFLEASGAVSLTALAAGCLGGDNGESGGDNNQTTGGGPTETTSGSPDSSTETSSPSSTGEIDLGGLLDSLSFFPSPDQVEGFDQNWRLRYMDTNYIDGKQFFGNFTDSLGQRPRRAVIYEPFDFGTNTDQSSGPLFRVHEWDQEVDAGELATGNLEQTGEQAGFQTLEGQLDDFYMEPGFSVNGVKGDAIITADSLASIEDARSAYQKMIEAGADEQSFQSNISPEMQKMLEEASSRDGIFYQVAWARGDRGIFAQKENYEGRIPVSQVDSLGEEEATQHLIYLSPDGELQEETLTQPLDQYWA